MGYGNSYGNGRNWQQGQNGGNDGRGKFFASTPRILYGIMKELQRSNALRALELKWQINEKSPISEADVDAAMSTDPGRSYGREGQECAPEEEGE